LLKNIIFAHLFLLDADYKFTSTLGANYFPLPVGEDVVNSTCGGADKYFFLSHRERMPGGQVRGFKAYVFRTQNHLTPTLSF